MTIRDNTNRRLKEVLDIMAEGSWLEEKPNGGEVLAEATKRVPFTPEEAELLSGGIPRGHKNLTKSTAGLVKAGWITKGRSGWVITDNGLRATVAFNTVEKLVDALNNNTLIPAGTPLPQKPAGKPAENPVTKSAKKPVTKAVPAQAEPAAQAEPTGVVLGEQPETVALAGDFSALLGASENWDHEHSGAQMKLDHTHGVWKLTADLPAGHYSYKVVVNGSWSENYGAYGVADGANHEFTHDGGPVTFHYSHATKDVLRVDS